MVKIPKNCLLIVFVLTIYTLKVQICCVLSFTSVYDYVQPWSLIYCLLWFEYITIAITLHGLRLSTSPGYPRLTTGIPVGKPMSMSTRGSESPGGWNLHRSKLGFQNTEYSCQVPVSTCAKYHADFFRHFLIFIHSRFIFV